MRQNNILLTPGPTPVPDEIQQLMAKPIIHHRTPQYRKYFESASERLKGVFLTKNPVYTITGSGSSAMEASVVNFHSVGDEVLVVEGGKFAERFTALSKAYQLKPTVIQVPWGEGVKPETIREELQKNPKIKTVFMQLCETSTAVLHDVKAVSEITSKTDTLLVVDAVSGLCADRLETDAWGVDIVASGSQKALMLPPGLGFISVSEKAQKRIAESNLPKYYLDLKLYEKGIKDWDTPFTPALTLVIGLNRALDLIEKEGIQNVFKRCEELGEFTRQQLKTLGMELFSKAPSATLSAAYIPEGVDGEKLVKTLRDEKGVTTAGGQGHLKGKIIRISHMGAITKEDLVEGLKILEQTLQEMGSGAQPRI